jgi:hypothetical protein
MTSLALEPQYTTPEINDPINLYEGALNLEQDGKTFCGKGKIIFQWLSSPGIALKFHSEEGATEIDFHKNYSIKGPEYSFSIPILNPSARYHSGSLSGDNIKFLGEAHIGSGENLEYVVFHIVNFHDYLFGMPCEVEVDGWKLIFNSLSTANNHIEILKEKGGFSITHIGKLKRSDCRVFSSEEAMGFLDICSHALSFARGLSISIVLPVGYSSENSKIWELWGVRRHVSSWKNVSTWFPTLECASLALDENGSLPINQDGFPICRCHPYVFSLQRLLPKFLEWQQKWKDKNHLSDCNVLLNMYLEANSISTVEVQLILIQAALELSSSVHLVKIKACFSEQEFKKLRRASEKIRNLLNCLRISTSIPCSDLPELYDYADTRTPPWEDSPHALTEVRNDFAHANKKYPDLKIEVKEQLCRLGLHYLELVLLALMGYEGFYVNRCFMHHESNKPIPVPWATGAYLYF